ncbi:MAG: Rrf2 family transcriptional regulator [Isosphaeraceae bacterium]
MRLSAKAEYACVAVIALARMGGDGNPVRVRQIASAHGIPERYLVQILIQLKAAGLVHSARGATGGYSLSRSPEQITLREVLRAIDGPGEPPREPSGPIERALASVVAQLREAEQTVLDRTTIAQLAGGTEPANWVI